MKKAGCKSEITLIEGVKAIGQKGFSLVEIMIAITILGLVLALVGTNVLKRLDEARVSTAQNQIRLFKTALLEYYAQEKKMPTDAEGLEALAEKGYLGDSEESPLDPWDNEYIYKHQGGRKFVIISFGADGAEGGEEIDADISSADLGKRKKRKKKSDDK